MSAIIMAGRLYEGLFDIYNLRHAKSHSAVDKIVVNDGSMSKKRVSCRKLF